MDRDIHAQVPRSLVQGGFKSFRQNGLRADDNKDERPVPPNFDGYYFSRAKVERVKDWLAFPLGLVFLVAPAMLFFFICSASSRLAILLAFIAGLALVMQIFLGTTRHQTLASALAYTGVLGLLISVKTDRCPVVVPK